MKLRNFICFLLIVIVFSGCEMSNVQLEKSMPTNQISDIEETIHMDTLTQMDEHPLSVSCCFEEGYLKNMPWDSPDFPYSKPAIYDQTIAENIAQTIISANTGKEGYDIENVTFDPVQMKWTVRFRLIGNNKEFSLQIMQENCRVILPEELQWSTLVADDEAANKIANSIKESWVAQNASFLDKYEVRYVFYEKNYGYWLVALWPSADYPTSELLTIVIDQKDCSIINAWLWELGFGDEDVIL